MRHTAPMLALALSACHSAPIEPAPPAPTTSAEQRTPRVHVIVEKDHRNVTGVAVGDIVELPHDAEFAWTISFENGSYFDPAPAAEAGVERYRASRTGLVRALVSGKPKVCMHSDAACPLAEYAWAITLKIE